MSFRPFSFHIIHRAWPAGFVSLAGLCIFLMGNVAEATPIEVVPPKGATINTNINQAEISPNKDFDSISPRPANPFTSDDSLQGVTPSMMPQPEARTLTPREKQLLERRKNWVFMTPEELILGNSADDTLNGKNKDGNDNESTTAMERYYENLLTASRSNNKTNQFDKDSDIWDSPTNSFFSASRNNDDTQASQNPFNSPFNTTPTPGVFEPMRPNRFSDVFGTGSDTTTTTPEMIQAQQEEKAHMDSFKQMWDIGQPSTPAPAAVSASGFSGSSSSSSDSSSFPSMQPVLSAATPAFNNSAQPSANPAPSTAPPLHITPPRPNFTIPQRPF